MTGQLTGLRRDAVVILGWFLVAGVLAGLLWWGVTPVPSWTRTADNATLDELSMGGLVAIDGWFVVIAAFGGLLSGILLTSLRTRDLRATVLLVVLGAGLASALMYLVGHQLGTTDLDAALRHTAIGKGVPAPLVPKAHAVYLVWPVLALAGALGVLLLTTPPPGAEMTRPARA